MADNVNRLLIVDEEREIADFVAGVARNVGYAVACAPSGASFVQLLESFQSCDPGTLSPRWTRPL
jgi:DNA-binding response OmpR family regulator